MHFDGSNVAGIQYERRLDVQIDKLVGTLSELDSPFSKLDPGLVCDTFNGPGLYKVKFEPGFRSNDPLRRSVRYWRCMRRVGSAVKSQTE